MEGEALRKLVEEVVKERFQDIQIDHVDVEGDVDQDGDAVLRIRIVFDADISEMKAEKMSGLPRHLRSALARIGEIRFPITSYISKNDYEEEAA
ncbi:MAG: hypothetical protein R3256_02390 [Thalassovita sp.]|nr:hypothetical protein [Thalassovita sp.]